MGNIQHTHVYILVLDLLNLKCLTDIQEKMLNSWKKLSLQFRGRLKLGLQIKI